MFKFGVFKRKLGVNIKKGFYRGSFSLHFGRVFSTREEFGEEQIVKEELKEKSNQNWVERAKWVKEDWKPYLKLIRADKPIGSYLLMWPGFFSLAMASTQLATPFPSPLLLSIFGAGAFLMRGSGCIGKKAHTIISSFTHCFFFYQSHFKKKK